MPIKLSSHSCWQAIKLACLLSPLSRQACQANDPLKPIEPKPLELFEPVAPIKPVAPVDVEVLSLIGRRCDDRLGGRFGSRRSLEVREAVVVI
jgi:hypothetical protein